MATLAAEGEGLEGEMQKSSNKVMKAAQTGVMVAGWRDVDQPTMKSVDRIHRTWEGCSLCGPK